MENGLARVLHKAALAGATAIGATVHPIEDHLGLIGHEGTTIAGRHLQQGSVDHIGVVTEQTYLCLPIRRGTVKLAIVDIVTETALHPEMFTFLVTKEHDLEKSVDRETPMIGQGKVDVDPEILVTHGMALPMIARTVAGAIGIGTEQEIHATLDETDEMVEHAHEVRIAETEHASGTEIFTGGRVVCISKPYGPRD